jgi:hypothetical protein
MKPTAQTESIQECRSYQRLISSWLNTPPSKKAGDHYVRSQYAQAVDVLSGVGKEIDALVAKHPPEVAKWYPSIQKAMVYAILAESHKRQSTHYERLYSKGWGKTVPMDEALRIIERDKPQSMTELVPKKSAPTNDADFPL